jgi:hypothetical protein
VFFFGPEHKIAITEVLLSLKVTLLEQIIKCVKDELRKWLRYNTYEYESRGASSKSWPGLDYPE